MNLLMDLLELLLLLPVSEQSGLYIWIKCFKADLGLVYSN